MSRLSINQAVDVHSLPPANDQISGVTQGDEHVHAFDNLIPACEFAVSLASEGHSHISLSTEFDGVVDLDQAQRIVRVWHAGRVQIDAEEIDF